MLRSISFKLTLAFIIVAIVGVSLVSLIINRRVVNQFNQLELNRYQFQVEQAAQRWYVNNNRSWDGIDRAEFIFGNGSGRGNGNNNSSNGNGNDPREGRLPRFIREVAILDESQMVVYTGRDSKLDLGELVDIDARDDVAPIEVRGKTVGWLVFITDPNRLPDPAPGSFEFSFLSAIRGATILGALGVGMVAIVIGVLLANTLTQPLRELTQATDLLGSGQLGHQVSVNSRDEIGHLANAFNRMSQELEASQQLRRQMTADIAHDLRTPLSVILGYTEALSDGKLSGDTEIYSAMYQEAQHLNHLIDDLRILSLADAGELNLNKVAISAAEILRRIEGAYRMQAADGGIQLVTQLDGDRNNLEDREFAYMIDADPDRVNQILSNLVSNALRYTPDGGEIAISAVSNNGSVRFEVADTGFGIAESELPHIFERFYRGDASRNQAEGESGLGLAIVKSLVEAHNGQISVTSRLGEGTRFLIEFPRILI